MLGRCDPRTVTSYLGQRPARSYVFGPFRLVPERQLLMRGDTPVSIGGRALDILAVLVARPGEVIGKSELLARVWPNTVVEESNLKVNVAALRRTLGEEQGTQRYIATEAGRGYRFVAPVQFSHSAGPSSSADNASFDHHNLPLATSSILGRSKEIAEIRQDLEEVRLVSIVGAGGIGKTTVALAVGKLSVGRSRDGVWLVDLSHLKEEALVPDAIASAIGLAAQAGDMLAALCGFLRDRQMLLILDNCEHLIASVVSCVDRILTEAAGIQVLATSREPLRAKDERVRRLPGLATPSDTPELTAAQALTFPAIQLFVERTSERLEGFSLADADAAAAGSICRRLDGVALAIELAATRVDVFGVTGLLQQLDDRFRLLTGWRTAPERHRTLVAMLDWSYSLLAGHEAAMLRAVSVFAGPFGIEAAVAVSRASADEAQAALAQLVAKSLLAVSASGEISTYYLLETTRSYASERLRFSDLDQAVRCRHAEHVCAVLERAASEWGEIPARAWGIRYRPLVSDLRGALAWAAQDGANRLLLIRLTAAGSVLWNHLSQTAESLGHVSKAVTELNAAGLTGTATEMQLQLALAGATLFLRGPNAAARRAMQRSLDIAVEVGCTDYRLRCLRMIGVHELFTGNHQAAGATLQHFAAVAEAHEPDALVDAEAHLCLLELYAGRLHSVRQRLERIYQAGCADLVDSPFVRFLYDRNVDVGNILSYTQWLTGSPDTAMRTAEATVNLALQIRHGISLSNALAVAACPVFFLTGSGAAAVRFLGMLDDQILRTGYVMWRPMALFYRGALACADSTVPAGALADLERAVAEFEAQNHMSRMPFILGILADALAKSGRRADAARTIEAALARAAIQGERWCVPELLRIKAAIAAADGASGQAEALLVEALTLAADIGALSWRLRAAMDLARLWDATSRAADARRLLAGIFGQFKEGFATRDLVAAAELLTTLQGPAKAPAS